MTTDTTDVVALKAAVATAVKTPTNVHVGAVIKAMRKNPPVASRVMRSLPKGDAAKIAAMIAAFWDRTLPF